jgi:16S rRNA (adenine1518-N6/adenine1519-N6)-dimethyltransferase
MPASWLANRNQTRAVLERHGFYLKHRLGQNFLVDDSVIAKILRLAELDEHDIVLEVGPGIGTLTVALLAQGASVVAIEADPELPAVLAETCARDSERLTVISGDALKVAPSEIADAAPAPPTKFVSNLPYQVAATLILKVLEEEPSVSRLVCMVQAEVADRIAASPGTKAYGAYTAKLSLLGTVSGRFEVGPASFMPPPHVSSAVVRIERDPKVGEDRIKDTMRVIDGAFCQRRKTIRNSLSAAGFERQALDEAFAQAGISATCRAETLAVCDFCRLEAALAGLGAFEEGDHGE